MLNFEEEIKALGITAAQADEWTRAGRADIAAQMLRWGLERAEAYVLAGVPRSVELANYWRNLVFSRLGICQLGWPCATEEDLVRPQR